MDNERETKQHYRTQDHVLIGLTLSMFITNIILIAVLATFSYRVSLNNDRWDALKQDYTIRLEALERKMDVKHDRLSETIRGYQDTTDRRIELMKQSGN